MSRRKSSGSEPQANSRKSDQMNAVFGALILLLASMVGVPLFVILVIAPNMPK